MKDIDVRLEVRLLDDRVKELETIVKVLLKVLNLKIELCDGLHLAGKEN